MTDNLSNEELHEMKNVADDTLQPLLGVPEPPLQFHTTDQNILPHPIRTEVLREANSLVNGQRQEEYGTPMKNMTRIMSMVQQVFPERQWKPSDIPLFLLLVKIARAAEGYKWDTAVDLAGYASLWAEVSEEEKNV